MKALDRQLAELHVYANELEARLQDARLAPAPASPGRPDPTSQPHHAHSQPSQGATAAGAVVVGPCTLSGDCNLYANALPPAGTNHVYGNAPAPALAPAPTPAPTLALGEPCGYVQPGGGGSAADAVAESLYEPIGAARATPGSTGSTGSAGSSARGEPCTACGALVLWRGVAGEEACTRALGRAYHARCLACSRCSAPLALPGGARPYTVDHRARIHCLPCFHDAYAPRCSACGAPITGEAGEGGGGGGERVMVQERAYHAACARCQRCAAPLLPAGGACYPLDGRLYCRGCNALLIQRLTATATATAT